MTCELTFSQTFATPSRRAIEWERQRDSDVCAWILTAGAFLQRLTARELTPETMVGRGRASVMGVGAPHFYCSYNRVYVEVWDRDVPESQRPAKTTC
jgi:hypothetical protein